MLDCPTSDFIQINPDFGCKDSFVYDYLYSLQLLGIDDQDGTQFGNVI